MKILLVEDNEIVRIGLKALLEQDPDLQVVADIGEGELACSLAQQMDPHVVLMDIGLPGISGIEATRQIKCERPDTKVIMLTDSGIKQEVISSFVAGADSYCSKGSTFDHLVGTIKRVCQEGGWWIDQMASSAMGDWIKEHSGTIRSVDTAATGYQLTSREENLLRLVVEGKNNQQIAEDLHLSVHTVKFMMSNVLSKMGVSSRTEAAVEAIRTGVVEI